VRIQSIYKQRVQSIYKHDVWKKKHTKQCRDKATNKPANLVTECYQLDIDIDQKLIPENFPPKYWV